MNMALVNWCHEALVKIDGPVTSHAGSIAQSSGATTAAQSPKRGADLKAYAGSLSVPIHQCVTDSRQMSLEAWTHLQIRDAAIRSASREENETPRGKLRGTFKFAISVKFVRAYSALQRPLPADLIASFQATLALCLQ